MFWDLRRQLESADASSDGPPLCALAKLLPAELLQEALQACDKTDKRLRKLPLPVVMWLVVGMSLYRDLSIGNVLRRLVDGLGLRVRWGRAEAPHSTSLAQARDRLGWKAVRELFQRFTATLRSRFSTADLWHGYLVCVIDGTGFRTPDTELNEAEFGRPGSGRGRAAFPQFRGVLLTGAWSHLVFTGLFGHYRMGELTLATHLLRKIPANALVLADRLYFSFAWLAELAAGDRFFVVRAKTGKTAMKVSKNRKTGPNEWLGELRIPGYLRKKRPDLPGLVEVRLIKLRRKGFRDIELITNLPASDSYTATEIAALYLDRWEVELGIRELKCSLNGTTAPAFRSHRPDRVKQELYGLLVAYNGVRALMAEAAEQRGVAPNRLSFTDCLAQIRTFLQVMAHVDPDLVPTLRSNMIDALAACELPRKRARTCPREVRIKMSKYKKKWKPARRAG